MHTIEPFYNWRLYYAADEDEQSPFFGKEHEQYTNSIYNYWLHPEWDYFGSSTLYCKLLFADYDEGFAVIELIGEWNDCLHNDIMYFKRNLLELLMRSGIYRIVFIGENVLNFHASDDCYYEELSEEIEENEGWIAGLNFREHVLEEMDSAGLLPFIHFLPSVENPSKAINWRALPPLKFCRQLDEWIRLRLGQPELLLNN